MTEEVLGPACHTCGRPSAIIKFSQERGAVRFIYSGPGGSNGSIGDLITDERANAIRQAVTVPFDNVKLRLAGLYDGAGFCGQCAKFYCTTHWNVSTTGGGMCPEGHFKSLDPHWSPDS